MVLLCLAQTDALGQTNYVDADATGANNGSSWEDAYSFLRDALADANTIPDVNEIRVAQGIYTPDSNTSNPNGTGDRSVSFQLVNSVVIKGGYAGCSNPDPNVRDIDLFETILSGDLNGNDVSVQDVCDLINEPSRAENSYHVVDGSGVDANTILDGFTISNGYAYGIGGGGGIWISNGSPSIVNCTLLGNSASSGGGLRSFSANPTLTNCRFVGNAGYYGGGINSYQGTLTLINCIFSQNVAVGDQCRGGGMVNCSDAIFTGCTFTGNSSDHDGGGVFNYTDATFTDCIFTQNFAVYDGGGMFNCGSPTLNNCMFGYNSAGYGGGLFNHFEGTPEPVILKNCDFQYNFANCGGGIYCWTHPGYPTGYTSLTMCEFVGNLAENYYGGAVASDSNTLTTLTNCLLCGNKASYGGAIDNYDNSFLLTNCTFTANRASYGGCINNEQSNGTVTNCIFWDDLANVKGSEITLYTGTDLNVSYSDLKNSPMAIYVDPNSSLTWKSGNIEVDPCFAQAGYWADPCSTPDDANDDIWVDGDYHFKSEGWRWDANTNEWTWDDVTSRCIDAGNPGSPTGDELLSNSRSRINMGAYGGTAQASVPLHNWALLADLTNDGIVDFQDYAHQAKDWQVTDDGEGVQQPGDLDRNGTVEVFDLFLFVEDWLEQTIWAEQP